MFALKILHARRTLISKFHRMNTGLLNNMILWPNFCLLNTRHANLIPPPPRISYIYVLSCKSNHFWKQFRWQEMSLDITYRVSLKILSFQEIASEILSHIYIYIYIYVYMSSYILIEFFLQFWPTLYFLDKSKIKVTNLTFH